MIELVIHGEAKGKGRPRFVRATGRTYTDAGTMTAEQRIQTEWIAAGRPMLDGPLHMDVTLVLERPQGHFKRDGSLSASGARTPWPVKKPDIDNALKLIADALNGQAYKDDAQIVHAEIVRRWAIDGEREHTQVRIDHVAPMSLQAAA